MRDRAARVSVSYPRSGAVGLDDLSVDSVRIREESGSHDLIQVEYRAEPKYVRSSLGSSAPISVTISSPWSGDRTWWGYVDTVRATPHTTETRAGSTITAFGLTRALSVPGSRSVRGSAHAAISELAQAQGLSAILLGEDAQVDEHQGDRSDWQLLNDLALACGARLSTRGARIVVSPVRELFDRAGVASPRLGLDSEPGMFDRMVEESASRFQEELPSRVFTKGSGNVHARGGWFAHVQDHGWGWIRSVEHLSMYGDHTMEVQMESSEWLSSIPVVGDPQAPSGPLMPQYDPRLVQVDGVWRWVL